MIFVPPIEIQTGTLVSSNVADDVYVWPSSAVGWISVVAPCAIGDQFQVHDRVFTIVSSGNSAGQVLQGSSDVDQAIKIADAVNRDLPGVVNANSDHWTTFLSAASSGAWGNNIVLAEWSANLSVSGSYLTGGIDEEAGIIPWEDDRTYTIGTQVIIDEIHTLYESVVEDNYGYRPDDYPSKWLDVGKSNRWKMFDTSTGSKTQNPDSIQIIISPGGVDTLALVGCNAQYIQVILRDPARGVVYNRTFYPPDTSDYTATMLDIPDYASANIEITISNQGATAACAMVLCGTKIDIGTTLYNPKVTMLDYSVKDVDEWGNYSVVERAYSRQLDAETMISMQLHSYVRRMLALYRATPVLFVVDSNYAILSVVGFYKDFNMVLLNPRWVKMSISIEGLV